MAKRDGRVCSRQRARQAGSFECSSPMRGKHYRNKLDSWTEALRLSSDVKLEMFNEGSGTATDIDVTLRFPPSVKLIKYTDFPARPAAPAPPNSPYRKNVEDPLSQTSLDLPHLHRPQEHTSELQQLMPISYDVLRLTKKHKTSHTHN